MNRSQRITVRLVGITLIVLTLLGITYAYYLTRIEGNTNEESISITTAKLELLYDDGNENLTFERIMPGHDMEPKTFTVTNNGNSKIDYYGVALEEVINTLTRTSDLTYTLTCVQKNASGEVDGTCSGKEGIFPNINSMLVANSIDVGYVHEYSLKVVYENLLDVDQSVDMGSTIKAKVQIYGLTDTVDLEGTVSNHEDGDYVQINSVTKKSNIVNNKYKLVGITPGIHTLKVCEKEDTVCSDETAKMYKTIVINKGETASIGTTKVDNVDVPLITITSDSRTSTVGINVNTENIEIDETIKDYDSNEGILAVNFTNSKNINLTTNKIVEDVDIKTEALTIPFSVKNISNKHQNITIKLTDIEIDDALKNVDFRWGLYNADTEVGLSFGIFKYTEDEELIYTDTIMDAGTETPNNYKLRIWVHNNGTAQTALLNKNFKAKVSVSSESVEYTDESCFTFDASTGVLSNYNYNTCGNNIVIPRMISNSNINRLQSISLNNATKLIIPSGVSKISLDGFYDTNVKHITLPEGITGAMNFNGAESISSLFIPSTVTDISEMVGFGMIGTKILIIPESVTNIGETSLYMIPNTTDIILMNGLKSIGNRGLWNATSLKSIEIPSSVISIGEYAFLENLQLEKIIVRGKTEIYEGFSSKWNCKNLSCTEKYNVEFRP